MCSAPTSIPSAVQPASTPSAGPLCGGQGQVAFRAPWVCPAPPLRLWALCSYCFFPWCQGVVSYFLFGCTQGCLVLCVGLFPPHQCALGSSCRCRLLGALFVCSRSCVVGPHRGPALRLGVCLLGFPAVVCAVTPIPTIASLCNKIMIQGNRAPKLKSSRHDGHKPGRQSKTLQSNCHAQD